MAHSAFKDLQVRPPREKAPKSRTESAGAVGLSPSVNTKQEKDVENTIDMAPPAKRQKLTDPNPTGGEGPAVPFTRDSRLDHIVLGINGVTKSLEKNKLALVVVCKQIEPPRVLAHLPVLCALKGNIPLCPLGDSSHTLGQYFGLKSVLALGFKARKDCDCRVWSPTHSPYPEIAGE